MKHKRILLIALLIVLVAVGFFVLYKSTYAPQPTQPTGEDLVRQIKAAGQNGQVPNNPFVVGESTISSVINTWGTPDDTSKTSVGYYASFDSHGTAFGYYRNSPVFDIRSSQKSIQKITLSDITNVLGDPANVTTFDQGDVHQKIYTYALNDNVQLKWILNQPADPAADPTVDHISIYDRPLAKTSIPAKMFGMTLDEKIGQLFMVGVNGTTSDADAKSMIASQHVGGIILFSKNMTSPSQTVRLVNQLKSLNKKAKNPQPLFFGVDQEGGDVDRMPSPILKMPSNATVGLADRPLFSYQVGQVLGEECAALGFNLDFAPVVDVIAHPGKSAIGERSFGTDPAMVSQLGLSTMKGIQSQHVISVLKHFPGYGSLNVDVHVQLATIAYGIGTLEKVDWVPYRDAINNGGDMVMVTHLLVPALDKTYPSSMSYATITGALRDRLGFDGVVITDDMTMGAITKNYSIKTAAVKAIKAGADVVLVALHPSLQQAAIDAVRNAVDQGQISENRIDQSVYRILQLKQKYGLSDQATSSPDIAALNDAIRALQQ